MRLTITAATILIVLLTALTAFAQKENQLPKKQTWQLLDHGQDSVYGASVNRAYRELLKGKVSHTVVVAVIDQGVDITHADLQGHIWTNKNEIPANGIDDDHNGYIDDVHGWNFLGGKDGRNIYATNSEADREYARLLPEFAGKDSVLASKNKDYTYFLQVKKEHIADSVGRNTSFAPYLQSVVDQITAIDSLIAKTTQKHVNYYADVVAFQPKDSATMHSKAFLMDFFANSPPGFKKVTLDSIDRRAQYYATLLKNRQLMYSEVKNDPNEQRKEIVGDDPLNINDRNYGNNLVGDQYADHGTHCAGIIAAVRNNGIGMDGVTDNVLIMPVRAVNSLEYGDERDKDIALAIRYAVDNGARIISMSFGKKFSPQKQWVDEAVKYAEKKNVLLIHAAGNNGENNDSVSFYPNSTFLDGSGRAKNMITVGAMSIDTGLNLTADFSNYGQKEVDLFAPGVAIYSSVPGNKYQYDSGTSMATPLVAGVAALVLEYYPNLTAIQLKDILLRSVTSLKGRIVYKPGSQQKVDFATLCKTGGLVNAYRALQLAAEVSKR